MTLNSTTTLTVRRGLETGDRPSIAALLEATGFFNPEELAVALELVDDRLSLREASHYRFLVAELAGAVVGYACWGVIPGTADSVDLYWIAVAPTAQGAGVGRALLEDAERWIASEGRHRIWIETAGRSQYQPTRAFYLARGCEVAAELVDYYGPGDDKVIFLKVLP